MSCCGEKRAQLSQPRREHNPEEQAALVYFQYVGRTGLTVIGRETRSRYRFDSPGAVVAVDFRDQHALEHVPNLRQLKDSKT